MFLKLLNIFFVENSLFMNLFFKISCIDAQKWGLKKNLYLVNSSAPPFICEMDSPAGQGEMRLNLHCCSCNDKVPVPECKLLPGVPDLSARVAPRLVGIRFSRDPCPGQNTVLSHLGRHYRLTTGISHSSTSPFHLDVGPR